MAVDEAFGGDIDYAQLVKIVWPGSHDAGEDATARAVCLSVEVKPVCGDPDPGHINTSYIERANLTMRMSMRRFTRLTNGFSKKIDNMKHAVALNFMYYNFLPDSPDATGYARDGSGAGGSRLGD